MSSGIGAIIGAYVWAGSPTASAAARSYRHRAELLLRTGLLISPRTMADLSVDHALLRRRRRRGLYCVDLRWCRSHAVLQARWVGGIVTCVIPLGVASARCWGHLWAVISGGCCSRSAYCRRCWCCWSGSGCRNRRAGCAARAVTRRRANPSPGLADGADRAAAADRRGRRPDHQEQLARPVQISAQPDRLLARQCRCADRVYGITLWAPSLFVLLLK